MSKNDLNCNVVRIELTFNKLHKVKMNNQIKPLRIFFQLFVFIFLLLNQNVNSQFTWTRTYGGAANDEAFSSLQTRDGNYVVVGDSGYGLSSVVIKYSKQGDVLWKKSLPSAERVYLNAAEDPGGNLYFNTISGLLKMNSSGVTLWKRNYSPVISFQYLKFVDNNKNLLCYGNNSLGKIDSAGRLLWYKDYLNNQFPNTFVLSAVEMNNSYYLTGIVQSTGYQGFIRRLDTAGNILWSKYTNTGTMLCSIVKSSNGSLIVSGNNNNYLYCRKVDLNGNTAWDRTYTSDSLMNGYAIIKAGQNKFAIASGGYGIHSKFIMIDSGGSLVVNKTHYYSVLDKVMYLSVSAPNDSGFIITGYIKPQGTATFNWLVVKTDKFGNTTPIGIEPINNAIPEQFNLYQNYPNPFNPSTNIRFEIPSEDHKHAIDLNFSVYDITGREVYAINESKSPGTYEITFDGSKLTSGIYFYTLRAGEFSQTQKMILLK